MSTALSAQRRAAFSSTGRLHEVAVSFQVVPVLKFLVVEECFSWNSSSMKQNAFLLPRSPQEYANCTIKKKNLHCIFFFSFSKIRKWKKNVIWIFLCIHSVVGRIWGSLLQMLSLYMHLLKQMHRITQNSLHLCYLLFHFYFITKVWTTNCLFTKELINFPFPPQ